jgi:dTDP-L-rhamnose 4-epimerase
MHNKHVLVTGGAGFIGSHLTDTLIESGYDVTVLDALLPQVHADVDKDEDGWPAYLNRKAKRIKGNLNDAHVFRNALDGVTHLVHLAASVGVGQSMTKIVDYTRNNVMGTATILEVISGCSHTLERMVVASSMSVYGEGEYVTSAGQRIAPELRSRDQLINKDWELMNSSGRLYPVPTAETKLLHPASIYAVNKRDHEEMFLSVGRALDIPTVALRLFNAYGSRQALSNPYTGVAAIFISRLLNDQAPLVFEDGEQMRDFVHVSDVAEAFATVLGSGKRLWDVFNVGSGNPITVNDIARVLARLLQKNIAPEVLQQYRVGDVRHCFADISKFKKEFNVVPKLHLESGMAELIEWVKTANKPVDRLSASMAELHAAKLVI